MVSLRRRGAAGFQLRVRQPSTDAQLTL